MSTYGMTTSKVAGPKDSAHTWTPKPVTNGQGSSTTNGKA